MNEDIEKKISAITKLIHKIILPKYPVIHSVNVRWRDNGGVRSYLLIEYFLDSTDYDPSRMSPETRQIASMFNVYSQVLYGDQTYGVEFSPDNKVLYASVSLNLNSLTSLSLTSGKFSVKPSSKINSYF